MSEDQRCALWYWSHGSVYVTVHDTEQEAAAHGEGMADYGEGAPAGVQYPDGTYVEYNAWPAAEAERKCRSEQARKWVDEQASKPTPATRKIRAPFDHGRVVTVLASEPSWLGAVPVEGKP